MRKNFGSKPWLYPQPVLMIGTYDENGKPNLMNAAWGGPWRKYRYAVFKRPQDHGQYQSIRGVYGKLRHCGNRRTLRLCGNRFRQSGAG